MTIPKIIAAAGSTADIRKALGCSRPTALSRRKNPYDVTMGELIMLMAWGYVDVLDVTAALKYESKYKRRQIENGDWEEDVVYTDDDELL